MRDSVLMRRVIATALRLKSPDGRRTLFAAPIVIDPTLELGYALAWRQQSFNTVLSHDTPSLITLALILRPGDTFLDVGANVGFYSSVLSRMAYVFPNVWF